MKTKSKLEVFKKNTEDMGMKKARHKSNEIWEYKELDEALYTWFRQQRALDHSVSSKSQTESQSLFESCIPSPLQDFAAKKRASFQARRFFHNRQQK